MFSPNKSLTLIELVIAIALLSVVVLALSGVDLFSRSNVIDSDRRATLQNEVSRVLEHMSKEIVRAIGSTAIPTENPIFFPTISGDTAIMVYVDSGPQNPDGSYQAGNGQHGDPTDRLIVYRYTTGGNPSDRYQIWYYDNYVIPASPHEVIAQNISSFNSGIIDNYVEVNVSACWDPAAANCGTARNNPAITMHTRIKMPSVSSN